MINVYKFEVSTNGRNSVVDIIDTNYLINKNNLELVRRVILNSLSVEYDDEMTLYLHYKEVKK